MNHSQESQGRPGPYTNSKRRYEFDRRPEDPPTSNIDTYSTKNLETLSPKNKQTNKIGHKSLNMTDFHKFQYLENIYLYLKNTFSKPRLKFY